MVGISYQIATLFVRLHEHRTGKVELVTRLYVVSLIKKE